MTDSNKSSHSKSKQANEVSAPVANPNMLAQPRDSLDREISGYRHDLSSQMQIKEDVASSVKPATVPM